MRAPTIVAACLFWASLAAASPEAAVAWEALANIKTTVDSNQPSTAFDPAASALDGKTVTLDGYMTPFNLGNGTTLKNFLMTGTPGTCPFCLGAGPEDFVIVEAEEPVPIDIAAEIKLTGIFRISGHDPTGFYYRLENARTVK